MRGTRATGGSGDEGASTGVRETLATLWRALGYVPVAVGVTFALGWYFQDIGLGARDVFASPVALLNPLWYFLSMFIHADWGHFWGNMYVLVPFGVALTLLTSNRHVFGVMLVSHVLGSIARVAAAPAILAGSSGAALGLVAATLVRAVGIAMQNESEEGLQLALLALLVPGGIAFLLIAIVAGGAGRIAHFAHFFAFVFGGAMEAMYVFGDHESEERSVPDSPFGVR